MQKMIFILFSTMLILLLRIFTIIPATMLCINTIAVDSFCVWLPEKKKNTKMVDICLFYVGDVKNRARKKKTTQQQQIAEAKDRLKM